MTMIKRSWLGVAAGLALVAPRRYTAKPTADWDAEWGGGFMNPENFTRFSYRSLSR
jgi:hypothetical protein